MKSITYILKINVERLSREGGILNANRANIRWRIYGSMKDYPICLVEDESGHYHLTLTELEKLRDMPPEGPKGDKGDKGDAATIAIGTTTTGAAGSTAKVTNTGTTSNAVFNFTIPRGEKGDKGATGVAGAKGDEGDKGDTGSAGAKGNDGKAATIAVGTTTTGAAGTSASVNNSGTTTNAILNFTIPRGEKGAKGDKGDAGVKGNDGKSATVAVGTTTTDAAGTAAKVTNTGTTSAAVLNFTIPRGKKGKKGIPVKGLSDGYKDEIWHFTLLDGSTVKKTLWVKD